MKKIFTFLFIIFITLQIIPQTNNNEFRATWVVTWEYINGSSTVEQNKARIRRILDEHKAANMTSVIWQVRQAGTAYYNSSFEPWGSYAGSKNPGFDPLQYAIDEAHKRGLELHAWFNVFSCTSTVPGAPANEHPEWICRDQSGNPMNSSIALSPGMAAARAYLEDVAMEIVNNYDIDGLHFDYVRWNEYTSSKQSKSFSKLVETEKLPDGAITNNQVEELADNQSGRYLYDVEHPYSAGVPEGFSSWQEWWRWSVTKFVKEMHDSVQAVKPWVRISVAAIGKYNWSSWQGYGSVYQDAALWFNKGYIDQLTPMHYHWLTGSEFYGMLVGDGAQSWGPYIQEGVAAGRLFSVGPPSYRLEENNVWDNHEDIVNSCRMVDWVDGFQFFSYASWHDYEYWNEAGSTFFKKKTKVRSNIAVSDSVPESPQINITKIDSLHYQLDVVPPAGLNLNQWFAVYKSTGNINTDNSDLIAVNFGNSSFVLDEFFTGNENFAGKYKFAATMLNRYWNESLPSNVVETDSIPSYPPVVLSSLPSEGDTLEVTSGIEINFSKPVDLKLGRSIHISPEIPLGLVDGSNDNTKYLIKFAYPFNYNTEYTLTIDTSATDLIGQKIDGNKDGIPGDPFVLHFRTEVQDLKGPVVIAANVDSSSDQNLFDVEDIITVLFDEQVDPLTITHSTVILYEGENAKLKDMQLKTVGNKSVLSFKLQKPLLNNFPYRLELKSGIKDLNGNGMSSDTAFSFFTSSNIYSERIMIDDFSSEGSWEAPHYSGSTNGIVDSGSYFQYSTEYYRPASSPTKSVFLNYQWDSTSSHLIREYLSSGAPRDIIFDTTYTLQVYIFGDGSGNLFRFAIDEGDGTAWPNHEVSKWYKIDWIGWKLVEWKLSDVNSVGEWIGDGQLDYSSYRIDSFQMTADEGSANYGRIYFDDFRLVKKSHIPVYAGQQKSQIPKEYSLFQNYPNPFNPSTVISFDLTKKGLVSLEIFDILGNRINTLIHKEMNAGHYEFNFNAAGLASGNYIYRLTQNDKSLSKIMILLK